MKILGIDYGTKRMGIAISDETQTLAREYAIWSPEELWSKLENVLAEEGVERVVLGLPMNLSGELTQKSEEVQGFADQLQKRISIPIELVDERLSSIMAENISGQKTNLDSLAAQIFLQNYLDRNKN